MRARPCLYALLAVLGCGTAEPVAAPDSPEPLFAGTPGGPKCVAVELVPDEDTIAVGETLQMTAAALNKKGNTLAGELIQWHSSFNNVAAVSSSGLVTGVSAGQTHILASCTSGSVDSSLVVVGP